MREKRENKSCSNISDRFAPFPSRYVRIPKRNLRVKRISSFNAEDARIYLGNSSPRTSVSASVDLDDLDVTYVEDTDE